MDQKFCNESAINASDLKSAKNTLHGASELIACSTPPKMSQPLRSKFEESQIQLPEKYRAIADLFNHMSCSLRLLHLRQKSPTFQNVSTQVEILAERKFSYAHLAQMKYILPEGICIDKVLVHDKNSLCMKPEMKITLVFDAVEGHSEEESNDLALRRYFSSRLDDFFKVHPEAADIPEAVLPEPFCRRACSLISVDSPENSSTALLSTSDQIELSPGKSQLYPSFSRHFSEKIVASQEEKLQCISSTKTSQPSSRSESLDDQESESRCKEECAPSSDCVTPKESFSTHFQPSVVDTPVHMVCPTHSDGGNNSKSPDITISVSPNSLMAQTPAQSPAQSAPGRLMPISDAKLQNSNTCRKSTSCYKPAKRVLDFSLEEEDNDGPDPCAHFLSIDLVNAIHSIFQSVGRTQITKEELLHKIITNSLDFVEIREVEEHVDFLEKMVPDWISKKLLASGDIMYCIKKESDLDSVRSRLFSNVIFGVQ